MPLAPSAAGVRNTSGSPGPRRATILGGSGSSRWCSGDTAHVHELLRRPRGRAWSAPPIATLPRRAPAGTHHRWQGVRIRAPDDEAYLSSRQRKSLGADPLLDAVDL